MAGDLIQVMLKHLPPSGAALRLLDIEGRCGAIFSAQRADLNITTINGAVAGWQLAPDSFDAGVAYDQRPSPELLEAVLNALRPGGRLVIGLPQGQAGPGWVDVLEAAGYTRILVEAVSEGVLLRGEKPHIEARTVDRIRQVADADNIESLHDFKGRYVHLLIRQTPNKPVWALRPDEPVQWEAVAINYDSSPTLLAFSSLPKAVAFMQPAVMLGLINDVNKVSKFSRETAGTWPLPLLFNPDIDAITGQEITLWPLDPTTAEAPDE